MLIIRNVDLEFLLYSLVYDFKKLTFNIEELYFKTTPSPSHMYYNIICNVDFLLDFVLIINRETLMANLYCSS